MWASDMATRAKTISPENPELEEQIAALLQDIFPKSMTSNELAGSVAQTRTSWTWCNQPKNCRVGNPHCIRPVHHRWIDQKPPEALPVIADGRVITRNEYVDWDQWESRVTSAHTNPVLNRMHRKGLVEKIRLPWHRSVDWSWRDQERLAREEAEAMEIMMAALRREAARA